jgi:DNA-binding MarR family transcriptional regulator
MDYETLAEFRYVLRRFLNRSAAAAKSARLTPQQHQALLAVRGHVGGAISIGRLAEKLMVKHHSAGELVERLLQAGLVERRTDPADRRRTFVSLSSRARRLLAALSTAHLEELRLIQPSLQRLLAKLEGE